MIATRMTAAAVALLMAMSSAEATRAVRRHVAWDGVVQGLGGSKIRGEVEMVAGKVAGTTAVEVTYARDAAGAVRPWHVHVGSCAKGGPVLGAASAYRALRVDGKGAAKGEATLRLVLPDSGSFYVNIHESAAAMTRIVACGDLMLEE